MKRPLVLGVLAAVMLLAAAGWRWSTVSTSYVPACPHLTYTADGNVRPLFCTIDNPRALEIYSRLAPHLLALGPSATPGQVEAAIHEDTPHTTLPELCSAYALAQHRWGWSFGVAPLAGC